MCPEPVINLYAVPETEPMSYAESNPDHAVRRLFVVLNELCSPLFKSTSNR
jgi:hypothetical protein